MVPQNYTHVSIILLLLCIAAICCAGCSQTSKVNTFTEDDNGITVTMGMSDTAVVTLESNPTTGYEWKASTTGNLVITDEKFVSDNVPGMVGEGGKQQWTLAANAPGTYEFTAVYERPWEETEADKTYQLTFIFT